MKTDDYYIKILANWLTLQPALKVLTEEELIYIYDMESRWRKREQILDRIYKSLMRMKRENLQASLADIRARYENTKS
jgi:hypothetical protein